MVLEAKVFLIHLITKKYHENANFSKMKYEQGHFYVIERLRDLLFTFRSSDLMATFRYILMNNFYPCFVKKLYILLTLIQ